MSKIKNVELHLKSYSYLKPFHIANSVTTEVRNVEVVVTTEEGVKGVGEASPSFRVCGETYNSVLSLKDKVDEIIGLDVLNYRKIFSITQRLISSPSLRAAVEFACIDAMCRELNIKPYQHFGGAISYIETDKTVSISTLSERVEEAIKIKEEGFNVLKIKVGENLIGDIEAMEEIYKKTKGMKYIVDANMGYTPKEAIYFVKKLYSKGIDIEIFEQPVKSFDIDGLRHVRFNSPFPVCADESAKTKHDVLNLIKNEAVDFINIKLMKCGLSDAISIIEIVQTSSKGLMIGCMSESSIGINQSVQLACGFGVFNYCDLDSHLMMNEKNYRGDFIQKGNRMIIE